MFKDKKFQYTPSPPILLKNKRKGRIVWVNGTFDVLHIGHIKLLEFAKAQGDYLIVGIDSDERIKQLKGPERPINNELARYEFLKALKCVNEVRVFGNEQELIEHIKSITPDIAIWGDEYENKRKIGAEYVKSIVYFKKLENYSSTNIIQKLSSKEN